MIYSEDEKKCIKLVAKWFRENKDFVKREDAIKELGVDNDSYDTLIKMMEHIGAVEAVETVMGKAGYGVCFRPSAYAEELAREIEVEEVAHEGDLDSIIELLRKDYLSKTEDDLKRRIGEIAQDFVNRGLFNNTARVSKQLHAEFEYIQKLIDYIVKSMKQNFDHIPLPSCKNKLFTIVEREYKKLIPKTTARLVEGSLAQKGMLENYGKGILAEMEKAKVKIEIRCAVLEKEKMAAKNRGDGEKWYQNRTIQAALITGGVMLLVALLTTPLWVPFINKIGDDSETGTNISTAAEKSGPDSSGTIDHNSAGPKELQGKPPPLMKRDETAIEPEIEKQESKSVYEAGDALLEIFKADSIETIPDLPIIRTYWKRDLGYSGVFLLPERASEIGRNSPYVARFSFYYEAKKSGKYGFTVTHNHPRSFPFSEEGNACNLIIGGVEIVKVDREPVAQGVCNLKKGLHRVEFWLVSKVPYWEDIPGKLMGNFQVKILTPGAFDAVLLTKDMMLLKKE